MAENLELLRASKAWPVVEAVKLIERIEQRPPAKGFVLFETGYGPSGLPHIGTFAEVLRTSLVRQAFDRLSGWPSRLYAFSDDMDGLRAVPDNIPDREMVQEHLHKPLTSIPDPFGTAESYGQHMNGRLKSFLDRFGFQYEFVSATECYRSGRFNEALRRVLARHEAILRVILPTLGPERRATYSPILPVSPTSGRVLQVPILRADPDAGSVTYRDPESGALVEQSALDGQAKLQWRPDWAMRWAALEVDYEMYGKDLIDSARLSGQVCRILGGTPPAGFAYEMFLDEHGQKISKSKGNGLSCDEWLTYGPQESLQLFMYQAPRKAKRLYFDVIPRHVDEYLGLLERYPEQSAEQRYHNPVWHLHAGQPPAGGLPISFAMLLNLASVVNAEAPAVLWSFIQRYAPEATPASAPLLDRLVGHALAYYRDFVKPAKAYRLPGAEEKAALAELAQLLERQEIRYGGAEALEAAAEAIQQEVYEIGKRHGYADNLRGWFQALYEILLGQTEGPRFGSFVAFYGPVETAALIRQVLDGRRIDQPAA